tara:strand:- start:6 stop:380 length:375 start_codon:yes stop_codon:yes gene_type:complete
MTSKRLIEIISGTVVDEIIEGFYESLGDSIKDKNVRRVVEIGLSLTAKVGEEGVVILNSMLSGKAYNSDVLMNNLSLREMSDLLDMMQGLEARQKTAITNILNATKESALKVSSILVRALLATV